MTEEIERASQQAGLTKQQAEPTVPAAPTLSMPGSRDGASSGLVISNVTIGFGGITAVDDVSFQVKQGEILALLGPSGCGKSTLLRTISGLEDRQKGSVSWDGLDQDPVPAHQRRFSLMFQDGQLFESLTVAGNIAYGLDALPRRERPTRTARDARVAELLELVGLRGMGGRSVATLSGGEQQRVALARALAPNPRMVLLDEPLSSLDRGLRERLVPELRKILRASETAALFVTHDHDEAFAIADRVAVMDHGRLLQIGSPAQVWCEPADRAVAEFIGLTVLPVSELPANLLPEGFADVSISGSTGQYIGWHSGSWEIIEPSSASGSAGSGVRAIVVDGAYSRSGFHINAEVEGVGRCRINVSQGIYGGGERITVRLLLSSISSIIR